MGQPIKNLQTRLNLALITLSVISTDVLLIITSKDSNTLRATSGLTIGSLNPMSLISEIASLIERYASWVLKLLLKDSILANASLEAFSALAC